jgi:hypothetical protein
LRRLSPLRRRSQRTPQLLAFGIDSFIELVFRLRSALTAELKHTKHFRDA